MMPIETNTDNLDDLNEVWRVSLHFQTEGEANEFVNNFPKSFKLRVFQVKNINDYRCGKWEVFKQFNTFSTNKTTGIRNETAKFQIMSFG